MLNAFFFHGSVECRFSFMVPFSLLQCGNLMLVEVIPKEPLSFSVFHYKNPKMQHTVQVFIKQYNMSSMF